MSSQPTGLINDQSDFHSDQEAAILRELARNGSSDEATMYGYGGDVESNAQSNGISNSFQDPLDSASLLQKLSSYEHPTSNNEISTSHQFASLLQAATTATAAEAAQTGHERRAGSPDQSITSDHFGYEHDSTIRDPKHVGYEGFASKHRSRSPESEEDQLAREREIWGPEDEDDDVDPIPLSFGYQQTPRVTANARAIGVHSAAALFRRPSKESKKYTRPPMSKLFTSLELTPEQFLHLQAASKNYMLDDRYPERRDCVGNKGRGDTDMTKLKLFGCVKNFLEDEGWGERCFGENAPGSDLRKLKWPQMKNKVVSLVTPLLRRMVTNERQRLYANESRKNRIQSKKDGETSGFNKDGTPNRNTRSASQSLLSPSSPRSEIDPKLSQYPYNPDEIPTGKLQGTNGFTSAFPIKSPATIEVKYLINIIKDGSRIKPRFSLTPKTCPGFASLVQHIQSIMDDGRGTRSIRILGPNGMVDIHNQSDWSAAIESIKLVEWMDGEVKCAVEMEED